MIQEDIDNYLLDFLTIPSLIVYSNISRSTKNIFKNSKYYQGCTSCINSCDNYSVDNICKFGDLNLLRSR